MKAKTHKAMSKRVRATGTGKLMRVQAASSHLLSHKSARTKTKLPVAQADMNKVHKLLPYI